MYCSFHTEDGRGNCQNMSVKLMSVVFKVAEHSFCVCALADTIQGAHKDCKKKKQQHGINKAMILVAQCLHYLCYFSS